MELNKIICGDSLEYMKTLPDKCIDLVLTDPPYGMNYQRHIKRPRHEKIQNDNSLDWLPEFLEQTSRISKDSATIYMFCSWHNIDIFKQQLSQHFTIRNMLIWDKGGCGMGDLETTFGSIYEICLFATKTPQKLNGKRDSDILRFARSGNANHPTEKPVSLIKFLIQKSTKEGDIILDPFLGSGTTARACKDMGRNYIGIEISPEYCAIAEKRLKQEVLF